MTADTNMADNVTSSDEVVVAGKTTEESSLPPLVLAALRLEKILYDHNESSTANYSTSRANGINFEAYYMNPIKVVRRWLGTSSGATSTTSIDGTKGTGNTVEDIQMATKLLLDPTMECIQMGRSLLLSKDLLFVVKPDVMDTDKDAVGGGGTSGDVDMATEEKVGNETKPNSYITIASAREVECWLFSLMIRTLWKQQQPASSSSQLIQDTMTFANEALLISTAHFNKEHDSTKESTTTTTTPSVKSSMYPLIARLYRFAALAYESYSANNNTISSNDMLSTMSKAHTLATVRRDVDTQATILNIMLRELLRHAQVEQAQTLLSNTKFPDEMASNNQYCRYLYYSGRIYALRLEYTTAYANLSQCLRKLPQNTGVGFRICVQRLVIVVQLLMGEIPDRHVFNAPECRTELQPYLSITTAVRHGDLVVFEQVVAQHTQRLQLDGTYTLISRLAHQVVKAGLRKLNISYSRLSLQDIATRLGLPSAKSAEYVVAKAVRDGVIDATIYHNEGYVESHDLIDVYSTKEPAEAFHRRIAYCLTTHNDAVRGMRYPPDAYKKQLEASRGNRRKRNEDNKTDEEKAKEYEDEFDDDY